MKWKILITMTNMFLKWRNDFIETRLAGCCWLSALHASTSTYNVRVQTVASEDALICQYCYAWSIYVNQRIKFKTNLDQLNFISLPDCELYQHPKLLVWTANSTLLYSDEYDIQNLFCFQLSVLARIQPHAHLCTKQPMMSLMSMSFINISKPLPLFIQCSIASFVVWVNWTYITYTALSGANKTNHVTFERKR